ncbi:MAG: ribonuclease III [Chloroflexi bacterium HGW-Chloroflexi-10]|jgi:ribonuclease-3|nr:MAG: ribonuclease III [Chloroflexi bacterium HGW-Chloroflexi-10]
MSKQESATPKLESPQELAERLNLRITDWLLLSRALTHRSYLNEHPEALEDNERLEFLGDAVLDFVVGAWLYHRYPEMPEGDLTRMRSALVHTEELAEFAMMIDLGRAMRLGRGETQAGGRNRPALLCDTFEAVVGALYLDGGIPAVNEFLEDLLIEASEDILLNNKNEDPKSLFQEWAQSQGYNAPQYVTRNSFGPDHSKVFEVEVVINGKPYGSGQGNSKQSAAKVAAHQALVRLGVVKDLPNQQKPNKPLE